MARKQYGGNRPGVARNNSGFFVDGLTEAKAALSKLPLAFREVAAENIDIGTEIMLNEALARVPVRTGALRASIGKNTREDGLQVAVGSGDFKAKFQEFGTSDTPRRSFLWPAYRIGARFIRKSMKNWANDAGVRATAGTWISPSAKNAAARAKKQQAARRAK